MVSSFLVHPVAWGLGIFLAAGWLSHLVAAAVNTPKIAEISRPEFDLPAVDAAGKTPRVSIVVPARDEAPHIEQALRSLLDLDYPDYEVIAVDDRSQDA